MGSGEAEGPSIKCDNQRLSGLVQGVRHIVWPNKGGEKFTQYCKKAHSKTLMNDTQNIQFYKENASGNKKEKHLSNCQYKFLSAFYIM